MIVIYRQKIITKRTLMPKIFHGMKRLLLLCVLFMAASFKIEEPKLITWKTLSDISFDRKWNSAEKMFVLVPNFGATVAHLKDKQVQITGYMIPINIESNYYVLSANPYASCFFCGGAGPESVMSIKFKGKPKRFDTDDRVTLVGKLVLNRDNLEELNYILETATLLAE